MLQTCQIFFPNKAIAVVEQGMMQEEERHIAVSGVTLGGRKESQTPRRETEAPQLKQKVNVQMIRKPFPLTGSSSFKVEFTQKASWTGKPTGKKGVDLCAAVQEHSFSRMYQKAEGHPQPAKGHLMPPANTNRQPCCGTHRNYLRTSERLRFKFQIKKQRMNTKQKYI